MTPELTFQLANLAAMPFWALMIVAPRWSVTRRVMESWAGPGAFAALYVALVLPTLPAVLPVLINPKLDVIASLLGEPRAAVVAWIHFLAFDLFVGRWEFLDAQQRGLSHWLLAPCLFFTLMLGPLGLLLYLAARQAAPSTPRPI
jgi:hypothetical protein